MLYLEVVLFCFQNGKCSLLINIVWYPRTQHLSNISISFNIYLAAKLMEL